jgi:hypothetical protein
VVGNVIWLLFAGWWLALLHLASALLLAITIIGLPLAVANVKLVPAALWPFGREVVRSADVSGALAAYWAQHAEARAQHELERPIPQPLELPRAAEERPGLAAGERARHRRSRAPRPGRGPGMRSRARQTCWSAAARG